MNSFVLFRIELLEGLPEDVREAIFNKKGDWVHTCALGDLTAEIEQRVKTHREMREMSRRRKQQRSRSRGRCCKGACAAAPSKRRKSSRRRSPPQPPAARKGKVAKRSANPPAPPKKEGNQGGSAGQHVGRRERGVVTSYTPTIVSGAWSRREMDSASITGRVLASARSSPVIKARINGIMCSCLVDTGAEQSCLSLRVVGQSKPRPARPLLTAEGRLTSKLLVAEMEWTD